MEKQTGLVQFLVIEPDNDVSEVIRNVIMSTGAGSVLVVKSLKEALETLNTQVIDVVISAWDLGGLGTGLALLKMIRGESRFQRIGFVLVSSASDDEPAKVRAARAARVDGYLLKPIREEILKSLIIEVVSKTSLS